MRTAYPWPRQQQYPMLGQMEPNAIYQDPGTGQWYDSGLTGPGDPGIPIAPPTGQTGNNPYTGQPSLGGIAGVPWPSTGGGNSTSGGGIPMPGPSFSGWTGGLGGQQPWSPNLTPSQQLAPREPANYRQPGTQSGGEQRRRLMLPGGQIYEADLTEEEYTRLATMSDQMAADAARQLEIQNNLQQGYLDDRRASTEAQRAYNNVMMAFNNEKLAWEKAKDAMEQSYRQQLLAFQKQQLMMQRRQRSPYRSAPVHIV